MEAILRGMRARAEEADAAVARRAVFEGAALEAVMDAAVADAGAARALRALRDVLSELETVPAPVRDHVVGAIDRVEADLDAAARRDRQRALLRAEDAHGAAALAVRERLDAVDPLDV